MPFLKYESFQDCVNKNKDKKSPEAFCAYLHHRVTGKWPSEKNVMPKTLKCPVCNNPVRVSRVYARLKCPGCRTPLVSVKVRRK